MKQLFLVGVVSTSMLLACGGDDDKDNDKTDMKMMSKKDDDKKEETKKDPPADKGMTEKKAPKSPGTKPAPMMMDPGAIQGTVGDPDFDALLDELCQAIVDWTAFNDLSCGVDSNLPDEIFCLARDVNDLFTFADCVGELEAVSCPDWEVNANIPSCSALTTNGNIL